MLGQVGVQRRLSAKATADRGGDREQHEVQHGQPHAQVDVHLVQAGGDVAADRRVGQVELEDADGPLRVAGMERQIQLDGRRAGLAGVVGVRVQVGQARDDLAVRGLERLVVIVVVAEARAVGREHDDSPTGS